METPNRLPPVLVLVGGFLGAGKTTLLLSAAKSLERQGLRAAIITNDQAGALVDSEFAEVSGVATGEVTGGCFCCRFSDMIAAAERLSRLTPGVIFAEAVGSCIDLSATILQPLKSDYRDRFRIAPFTVLVDPRTAEEMDRDDADPRLRYLFRNQVREADLVCYTKADLYSSTPPDADFHVSAITGQQVGQWLDAVLEGDQPTGQKLLPDVDYTWYAEAEAALGWLNWRATVHLRKAMTPPMVAGPLLDEVEAELTRAGAQIAHLKLIDRAATGFVKASLCRNGDEPRVEGDLMASAAAVHTLTLNLRAVADPALLRRIVSVAVARLGGRREGETLEAFRPSPPKPEHRLTEVIK